MPEDVIRSQLFKVELADVAGQDDRYVFNLNGGGCLIDQVEANRILKGFGLNPELMPFCYVADQAYQKYSGASEGLSSLRRDEDMGNIPGMTFGTPVSQMMSQRRRIVFVDKDQRPIMNLYEGMILDQMGEGAKG